MTTLPTTSSIRLPRTGGPGGQVLAMPSTPLVGGMPAAAQPLLTPADIMRVLRGNLWLIVLSVLLASGVGVALFYWQLKTNPRYTAEGMVELTRQVRHNARDGTVVAVDDFDLKIEQKTQAQQLMQSGLWMQVIEQNPEVRESGWFKAFQREAAAKKDDTVTPATLAREDLGANFSVAPLLESKLMRISMESADAEDARKIIQAIVNAHIESRQRATFDRTNAELESAKQWATRYDRALSGIKVDLARLQGTLNNSGAATGSRINIKEMEISTLLAKHMEAKLEADEADAQLGAIMQSVQNGTDPAQVEMGVRNDPTVQRLKSSVEMYDLELQSIPGQGDKSRHVQQMQARRDAAKAMLERSEAEARATLRNQLIDSMRSVVQAKKAEAESLAAQVDTKRAEIGELSAQMSEFLSLKDEQDSYKVLKREMDERVALLQNALRQETAGIRWAATPTKADGRSPPKLGIYLPAAIFIGLAFSLGIAFLRELMDTSVRSPRDVLKVGPMNMLGMISAEGDDPQLAGVPLHLVISQAPHSIMAEQFRQVRTRLQHAASLDTTRTIVITSPGPQDGKSTVACNLAAGLALNGRRILLVDANFRRPELHKLFGVPNDVGLANVLDSLGNLESSVQKTATPNLDLLTTGPRAANPTELLESQLFSDFIDRSLEEYDHVIFDTGPLLVVSEAIALAPRVDGVITVVRAKKNSRGMLTRVRDTLKQIKAEHLGVVLNGVQTWGGGYYARNIKTYYAYQNAE